MIHYNLQSIFKMSRLLKDICFWNYISGKGCQKMKNNWCPQHNSSPLLPCRHKLSIWNAIWSKICVHKTIVFSMVLKQLSTNTTIDISIVFHWFLYYVFSWPRRNPGLPKVHWKTSKNEEARPKNTSIFLEWFWWRLRIAYGDII